MRDEVVAVVPFLDQAELVIGCADSVAGQVHTLWLADNGSARMTLDDLDVAGHGEWVVPAAGLSIYRMWERFYGQAVAARFRFVLLLNSDTIVGPGAVEQMRFALLDDPRLALVSPAWPVYPDVPAGRVRRVTGTYRAGGVLGWAMMLDATKIGPTIDCGSGIYEWWYGDDHLVRWLTGAGWEAGVVGGARVDHVGEGTARHHDWTHDAKERDAVRFRGRWG